MDKQWLNNQINMMLAKKYSQPMTPQERVKGGASALPVIGDAISGYDAYQSAKQGDYLGAALNAVGMLPLVPGLAGVTKNHTDEILNAIKNNAEKGSSYGIRVIPDGDKAPSIGDVLNKSFKWIDGEITKEALKGTSTMGISRTNEKGILDSFHNLGIHDYPGKKVKFINYYGDNVVVVKGKNKGRGNDPGERLIDEATVIWTGKKQSKGKSDLK